jgi:hypothetical protein
VKPGTKEWAEFKTSEQMYNACQIPSDILKTMSTKDLVSVCLDYPLLNNYVAFNDERTGVNVIINDFNGLWELSQRKDGAKELICFYSDFPILTEIPKDVTSKNYHVPYKVQFLELVLSDNIFISQLDSKEMEELRKTAVSKYANKVQNLEIYSLYNVKKTILLAATIMDRQNAKLSEKQQGVIKSFIKDYNQPDANLFTEISKIIAL